MEALLFPLGMLVGILTVVIGFQAERMVRRHSARSRAAARAALADDLRRQGWIPPSWPDVPDDTYPWNSSKV